MKEGVDKEKNLTLFDNAKSAGAANSSQFIGVRREVNTNQEFKRSRTEDKEGMITDY